MPNLVDDCIVLRAWDWSETSQTTSLFCRDHGMLRGIAKGARRDRGRFSGGFDLLTRGQIVAVVKPDRELQTLTEWTLQRVFRRLQLELYPNLAALYMADVLHRMLPPSEPYPVLFDALHSALAAIDGGEWHEAELLRFQCAFLRASGHEPNLACANIEPGRLAFSAHDGGLVDYTQHRTAWRVRPSTIEAIRVGFTDEPIDVLEPEFVIRGNRLLSVYVRELLGEDLCTRRMLSE